MKLPTVTNEQYEKTLRLSVPRKKSGAIDFVKWSTETKRLHDKVTKLAKKAAIHRDTSPRRTLRVNYEGEKFFQTE